MKSGILTEELVEEAFRLARPSIEAVLEFDETTWGPKYVVIAVMGNGLDEPKIEVIGEPVGREQWDERWGLFKGISDFEEVALKKLQVVLRLKKTTSKVVALSPWELKEGEFLYSGGVYRNGLGAAASGAYGDVDEGIAWTVCNFVAMFCLLRAKRRREAGNSRI